MELYDEIMKTLKEADGDAADYWEETGTLDTLAMRVKIMNSGLWITTRRSRDVERRNNGGEYDFWTHFSQERKKVTMAYDWSCDFSERDEEPVTFEQEDLSSALVCALLAYGATSAS